MNAKTIINELDIPNNDKLQLNKFAFLYDMNTPDALYQTPYELAEVNHGTSPEEWERFLDIPEIYRYRHGKIAKLQEYAAVKALKQLEAQGTSGSTGAVSALKEIANLSKQLQANNSNKQTVLLTYVSPKKEIEETEPLPQMKVHKCICTRCNLTSFVEDQNWHIKMFYCPGCQEVMFPSEDILIQEVEEE